MDDKDHENILDRLANLLPEPQTSCNAGALIGNHAHFLFRTGSVPLATSMGRLLTGYAIYFNSDFIGITDVTGSFSRIDTPVK